MESDRKTRVIDATRSLKSSTRQSSYSAACLALVSSVAVAAALFFAFDGLRHGQGRPSRIFVASLVGWTAVAMLSMWSALARGRSAIGRSTAWLRTVSGGTPAVLFAMMYAFAMASPELADFHAERVGFRCLGLTLAGAALPLVALILVRRGSDPVHPVSAGAALGAACGALAGVMVELWCPVVAPRHVIVGHVLPIAILAILGAALGGRMLAMRPSAIRGS